MVVIRTEAALRNRLRNIHYKRTEDKTFCIQKTEKQLINAFADGKLQISHPDFNFFLKSLERCRNVNTENYCT